MLHFSPVIIEEFSDPLQPEGMLADCVIVRAC